MSFLKKIFNLKKMPNKNNVRQRKIDESVKKTVQSMGSQFALVSKMEIKAWKAYLALFFIVGLTAAIIFSVQTGIQTKSSAKSTRAEELEQIKKSIKDKGAKWEAADNPIFQLSDEERKKRAGLKLEKIFAPSYTEDSTPPAEVGVVPASLDWRNNGGNFVTSVKNQGGCASCWAFAQTAQLESNALIAKNQPGTNLDLSEQVMVSCSGAGSCSGGGMASSYVRDVGLPVESCYPYTATNGVCSNACANWQETAYKTGRIFYVPRTLSDIKTALASYGPLQTTLNVYSDFYSYHSGVYTFTSGSYVGSHAVLLIGYDDPGQYFIIKNSWGTGWGEAGFFKIAFSELSGQSYFGNLTYAYSNTPPAVDSITVSAPNGGETWDAGGLTTRNITWNYLGDSTAYVKIELLKAGSIVSTITSSTPISNKTYGWQVPANLTPGSDYKIRITSTGNGVTDSSNSDFTITAPIPPSLSLSSPNGGETWNVRNNQSIQWDVTGNPGNYLKVELLKGGIFNRVITNSASTASGSLNWSVPRDQVAGTDYQVRITSTTMSSMTDTSEGNFIITSNVKQNPGKGNKR